MQQMGYTGKGPIAKCQEGFTKPLDPPSQFSKDKIGLGYEHTLPQRRHQINIKKLSGRQRRNTRKTHGRRNYLNQEK